MVNYLKKNFDEVLIQQVLQCIKFLRVECYRVDYVAQILILRDLNLLVLSELTSKHIVVEV